MSVILTFEEREALYEQGKSPRRQLSRRLMPGRGWRFFSLDSER